MEEKQIMISDRKVKYIIRRKKVRGMRLAISCDGSIAVTAPHFLKDNLIEKFIFEKSKWILRKLDYFRKQEYIFIELKKKGYAKYKGEAFDFAEERIKYFNSFYKFEYGRISIRNQKSRWGSCSRKKNLNFCYKIAFLPKEIADYIIVHELCHLMEFNHSKSFWKLVSKAVPDYAVKRKELKRIRFI